MSQAAFPDTRWTLVVAAGGRSTPAADDALAHLCRAYWYPLYAYVRRQAFAADDARDLTQDFFAHVLERRLIGVADREKGRFRSFLLITLKRFLSDRMDRRQALKRGGNVSMVSIETTTAEQRFSNDVGHDETPERLFEREWALTLISRVTTDLRLVLEREGSGDQFEHLKGFLPGHDGETPPYAEAAKQTGMSEGALKVAVHRLRRRYREMFQTEMAQLVADPNDVDAEIHYLLNALRT